MNFKRILPILIAGLIAPFLIQAQVTTSSITGTVKSDKGDNLEGATIQAVHVPSGTVYSTVSRKGGTFNLPGMRVGGPYTLTVSFVGLRPETVNDITLALGEPYNLNLILSPNQETLAGVVVKGVGSRLARDKTGASTNINSRMLSSLPSFSRSITDFTRLTPQANGTSFAGRDGRFNNVTVDGANLNNNFGLSNDPLPGGGGNPVSLDALEEVSVNIAPYDVRQANFTGANISAVTKSGTNKFKGSLYTAYRDQSFNGLYVGSTKLTAPANNNAKTYGGTLGGPIIKDKLFFFVNYEHIAKSNILNYYNPTGGTGVGNTSAVPLDSMKAVSDYLKSKYNYDAGTYDNFNASSPITSHSFLGKIDWNISSKHKLTLKYNDYLNAQTFLPSQSGGINGASSSGLVTYGPKFSKIAMGFGNTVYTQNDKVQSGSFELSSNFNSRFSNQLLLTYTKISTNKAHPGAQFPFVDLLSPGSKNNYISFGNEPFNGNYNVVLNDVYTVTDNFTYYAGKHTLTAGASYEFQKVGNGFMPGSQGYYVFKSVTDFITNQAPILFSQTYSMIKGQDAVISAQLKIGQLGVYVQDDIVASPNFNLKAGVRLDMPVYPEQPLNNPSIAALPLLDQNGNTTYYSTGKWPKATPYISPRVGFRWTPGAEKNLVVRGGTGLFTGRIPFVYLTNISTGSGMYQFGALVTDPTLLANMKFNPDPHAYNPFYNTSMDPTKFPTVAGTAVPTGAYALTSKNFKFPQVWRTDFGVDKQLGNGWTATLEFLYTKDLNAVYMFNANQAAPTSTINVGGSTRPSYTSSASRKVNGASGNAIVLANTGMGYSFSSTAQLSKAFGKGFFGQIAYTYTLATDVTANPGSQATSVWSANPTSLTQNDLELSYSNFMVPHRIIASLSYRVEYIKHLATTLSVFYQGSSQGNYSYIYNGDVNNDGNSADLMYIPKSPSQINFLPFTTGGVTFTAQQQSDAFFKYIAQDKYLSKHQGQIAERYAARFPFYHRVDMKLAQDIFTNIGGRRSTLQFTADLVNALNFFERSWGINKLLNANASNPLKYVSATSGQANYNFATYIPTGSTTPVLLDKTFVPNYSTNTTWTLLLGLKFIF